ncbi:TfuA-like protein [Micromonospora chokoriensis]
MTAYLFLGPTGHKVAAQFIHRAGLRVMPPAARGDVKDLVDSHRPGAVLLVDGRFGDVLSVGHRELLHAVDQGWQVWGVASMGAIRAAELGLDGVHGYGQVYEHLRDTQAPDDEVALLHGPAPDYLPMSEALVDLRAVLGTLASDGALPLSAAQEVERHLANRWFGDRTMAALVALCEQVGGPGPAREAAALRSRLPELRVKTRDLINFLQERPWHCP